MDEAERAEIRAAVDDVTAIASVAIQGLVALCAELAVSGNLDVTQLGFISEFMLASLEKSGASEQLQSQLHESIGRQFSAMVAGLDAAGKGSPGQGG